MIFGWLGHLEKSREGENEAVTEQGFLDFSSGCKNNRQEKKYNSFEKYLLTLIK